MKKANMFVLVTVLVAVTTVTASAQGASGFIESWNTVSEGNVTPQLNVSVSGPLKGKIGWSLWTLTSKGWSEGYPSLTYAPAKWIEVSSGIGLETDDNPLRMGHSVFLDKDRWSLLAIYEHGGSGHWYRYLGKFQITKTIAVGVEKRRFFGTGFHTDVSVGKVAFWTTIGKDQGVAAVRFKF